MARPQTSSKKRSVVWRKLTGFTHGLYHAIGKSFLGKGLTAYRSVDTELHHDRRRTLREDCRPMSPARLAMTEAVRESVLMRFFSAFFARMAQSAVSYFGLFCLLYSIVGALTHVAEAALLANVTLSVSRLIWFAGIALITSPLLLSGKSALQLLVTGKFTQWFFKHLLSLPVDQMERYGVRETEQRKNGFFLFSGILLALLAGAATIWVHPVWIPLAICLIYISGLIIAFPEAGVVLSVSLLPLLWWTDKACFVTAITILLTWLGYGVKLLFLHRTLRFNLLDVTVLIFAVTVFLAGLTGHYVTALSVLESILLLLHLSLYFLITNLMHTRERMKRCLLGPVLTLGLVMLVSLVSALSHELLVWMQGSLGGDALARDYATLHTFFTGMLYSMNACVLLMAVPCLCATLFKKKTAFGYVVNIFLIALCFVCLYLMGAKTAMVIALICLLLFFLLFSHKCMAAGILSLPLLACGGVWFYTFFRERIHVSLGEMVQHQVHRQGIWQGVWKAFCENPAGIGLGNHAFTSVYPLYAEVGAAAATDAKSLYLSLLMKVGLPGFLIFLVMVVVFVQKTFTCIKVSESKTDTAMILGGMLSLLGLLGYGLMFSEPASLQIVYLAFIMMGISSAHQNMIFAEWDKMTVSMTCGDQSTDIMIHPSGI
ncbi:MAG: O-antigen ligase family protein [Clostridia bacterium]|nr:O-antigen ligase family protein [Clostridia bacterium]